MNGNSTGTSEGPDDDTPPLGTGEGEVRPPEHPGAAGLLKASPEQVRPGERVTLQVVNLGEATLSFGRPITVERWEEGEWVETPESRESFWTMDLLWAQAHDRGPEQHWPFLSEQVPPPGWYRFTKHLQAEDAEGGAVSFYLRARVQVEE